MKWIIYKKKFVFGFGFSCGFISSAAVMSQHFSGKKRYIFLSIHATGAGIGGMVYSYLMRYLSDLYGFRGALVIIGAISMNTVPGCILWKQNSNNKKLPRCVADSNQIIEFQTRFQVNTEDSGEVIMIEKLRQNSSLEASDTVYVKQYPVQHGETKTKTVIVQGTENTSFTSNKSKSGQTFCKNISQILRNRSFLFYVMGMVISAPSLTVVFIFVADIYLDNGMTNDDVSLGLLLMNVLSITGRLFPGIILQSKYIPSLLLPFLNAMLSAVLVFCFAFVKSRWHIIILSGAIGVPLGMSISMLTSITLKLVGSNKLPIAMGMFFTLNGIGQVISGPVYGYIRDETGSYISIFYISAGMHLVGAAIFLVALITRRLQKHHIRKQSSVFYLTSF